MFSKMVRSLSRCTVHFEAPNPKPPPGILNRKPGAPQTTRVRHQSTEKAHIPKLEYPKIITFKNFKIKTDQKFLEVSWNDETSPSKYPFVWLRDNCRCSVCFDDSSQSRTMLLDQLDLNDHPTSVQITDEGKLISMKWSDGHVSKFESHWLQQRSFDKEHQKTRQLTYRLERKPWISNKLDDIPQISFDEIMQEDEALLSWLQKLEVYGFVLICNAPTEYGQVRKLANRVAFIRKTHYGHEFSVKAKPNQNNVAYSSGPLQLHADLPYYEYKPGTQLIHCIVQYERKGGDSLIVDGLHAALKLKDKFPELFDVLASTPVDWCDVGSENDHEFFKILKQPIICLDNEGKIRRINFSQPQRDSFFSIEPEDVAMWYKAYKRFYQMLHDPQNLLCFKMKPGTIQSFDNLRILHGRNSYEVGLGNREVEGCYIDWDEVRSRRRVLEKHFKLT